METHDAVTPAHQPHRHWISALATLLLLIIATTGVVLYGVGYRVSLGDNGPKLTHTGILNSSSSPRGAQVLVNGHLTTATNNTVNLTPGKYTINMTKEGYQNWEKDVIIQDQLVTNADALLFPIAPTLQSISAVGITSPVLDPSGTKLAFTVSSESAKNRNGIYVLDMTSRNFPVLPFQSSSIQIADNSLDVFSQAQLSWSPDGQQLLASISGALRQTTTYLLQTNSFNQTPQDVTATLPSVEDNWNNLKNQKDKAQLDTLKLDVRSLIDKYFIPIAWSPDAKKILYQAKEDGELPIIIHPRRIGNNLLYERRSLKKGGIYIYDVIEDINTRILENSPVSCDLIQSDCHIPLVWFPDSDHLVYVHEHKINLVENDGSNMTTVYAGPFDDRYVYPWPDGTKLVIITNLDNTNIAPTLYTISLQ